MTTFDLLAPAQDSLAAIPALGRPHVFGLKGHALPVSAADASGSVYEIDVSLLMTPGFAEPFNMRGPRGAFNRGRLFILRCPGLASARGALARTLSVRELVGVQFDLVTAELVRPGDRAAPTAELAVHRPSSTATSRTIAPPDARAQRGDLRRHGSASAIEIDGVRTIAGEVSATLRTTIRVGEPITLTAPRGEIPHGAYFALRYFNASGARRALICAQHVRPRPGMLDEITGVLLRPTTPAPERQYYRAPFNRIFTAELEGQLTRTIRGCTIDLSAGGIAFRTPTQLTPGDRLLLTDPSLDEIDGAALTIVRVDPRDGQRYGARFLEPERGAAMVAKVLGFGRAEREHRRMHEARAARGRRDAAATPLTVGEARQLRNQRMRTRGR